ncbi:acid proteinase [Cubamyces sp. BRFM 1775]|nr:acid proteinase [Cubamyces sp. BRFM 1775]
MLASTLFFQVFAAVLVAGIPTSSERLAQRVARRSAGTHQSQPMQVVAPDAAVSGASDVDYTANWSGAVVYTTTDAPWLSVTGQFTVPTPHEPTNGTGRHSVSAWVGIDGSGCDKILQTGVDFTVNGDTVTYTPWYEWYPASEQDWTGFPIKAGDVITATVVATSATSGTATLINESSGQRMSHTFSGQPALCQYSAEWVVEDFTSGGKYVPLANFGTVTFTNLGAETADSTVGPAGARVIDIRQNGTVYTSASVTSDSVTVKYVGP